MSILSGVSFRDRAGPHLLQGGDYYAAPREQGFRDTPADELRAIVDAIAGGAPWREVVAQRFSVAKPWLHQIVTAECRATFVDQVVPAGDGIVADIGAGWGQITRPLAAKRPVVAIEPVAERLAFIRATARQENLQRNTTFIESDYLDLEFETKFSVICAIGVLEWVGAFQTATDPQQRQRDFLARVRRDLAPGGHFILGIENRIGLKYLLGCPDDHLGVPGIACLPGPLARQRWQESSGHTLRSFTYSVSELTELLRAAGFRAIEFFGAFPDYKLPTEIVPFGENGATLNAWLREHAVPREHNGYNGTVLDPALQETLSAHYRTLAEEQIAHHFVPSFFVRAR